MSKTPGPNHYLIIGYTGVIGCCERRGRKAALQEEPHARLEQSPLETCPVYDHPQDTFRNPSARAVQAGTAPRTGRPPGD